MELFLKVVSGILSYMFAGSATAGYYIRKNQWIHNFDSSDIGLVCFLMVLLWPFYILFLPMQFVYNQVKTMTEERIDKK